MELEGGKAIAFWRLAQAVDGCVMLTLTLPV